MVVSRKGIIKLRPCLRIRSNLPRNSTVRTVFGEIILIERAMRITSRIMAMGIPASHPVDIAIIGITSNATGTMNFNIEYFLEI